MSSSSEKAPWVGVAVPLLPSPPLPPRPPPAAPAARLPRPPREKIWDESRGEEGRLPPAPLPPVEAPRAIAEDAAAVGGVSGRSPLCQSLTYGRGRVNEG